MSKGSYGLVPYKISHRSDSGYPITLTVDKLIFSIDLDSDSKARFNITSLDSSNQLLFIHGKIASYNTSKQLLNEYLVGDKYTVGSLTYQLSIEPASSLSTDERVVTFEFNVHHTDYDIGSVYRIFGSSKYQSSLDTYFTVEKIILPSDFVK